MLVRDIFITWRMVRGLGFFIGDGAGIGKGRTIAGLILENWHHGRKKALWISTGSDMAFDARRDLDDAGATWIQIHSLNKIPYTKSLDTSEGVVFLSYHSLIASYSDKGMRRSRLDQLVDWCGPGYDGLIVFDECHKAKNLAPEDGRGTHTGLAVVEIQAKLPEARVIYCSATGASVPRNMAYMVRLGLWGDGTCFPKFRFFLRALEKGGTGTLELVAMEMKGRGMYLSRTLSYKGAEFDVVEVPLAAKMTNMYKKAAEFWAELRKELIYAIDNFSSTRTTFSQLWRLYWSNHQRFFRQMCVSAKVPAAVRLATQALADSKCVVIGLQTTGEARTEEAVANYGVELDDFISGPREILIKFIENNYPLPEEPESLSGDGGVNGSKRKRDSATPDVSLKGRAREEESEADSEPKLTLEDEFYKSENMSQEEKKRKWNSRVNTPANSSCKVNGYPSFAPKPENTKINQMAKRRKGGSASIKTEPKDFDDTKGNIKDIVYIDDEILPTYPASDASSNNNSASIKTEPQNFVAVNGNFIDLVVIDDEILPTDSASDASRNKKDASIKTEPKNFDARNEDIIFIDDEVLPTDPASYATCNNNRASRKTELKNLDALNGNIIFIDDKILPTDPPSGDKTSSSSVKTEPKNFDDVKGNMKDFVYIDDEILPTNPASNASWNNGRPSVITEPNNFDDVKGNFKDFVYIDDKILQTDPAKNASTNNSRDSRKTEPSNCDAMNGNITDMVIPPTDPDSDGSWKNIEDPKARKAKLLDYVRALELPNNPLDDIVDQLGGPDKVAEITGRCGMLVKSSNGKSVNYQARKPKDRSMQRGRMVNVYEKKLFMDGKKLVAIISEAGSSGVSLQADRKASNQRRRVHITLELPWSADRAIQQFGRTHRSNQTSAPEYRIVFSNLGGERRFASIVAKRLESLGALTQGDRRSAGPSFAAFNFDNDYGRIALAKLYRGIMGQDILPAEPPGFSSNTIQEFIAKAREALTSVGIIRYVESKKKSSGEINPDMHNVACFLNRLLGIPPEMQNVLFELFLRILDILIEDARLKGQLDSGIVDKKASTIELRKTQEIICFHRSTGAPTVLYTFSLDRGFTWEAALTKLDEKTKDVFASSINGFYESKWMGKMNHLLAIQGSSPRMYKIIRPSTGESPKEMSISDLLKKYERVSSIEKACNGWKNEYQVSAQECWHGSQCKQGDRCMLRRRFSEVNILSGLILPLWGTVDKALSSLKQVPATDKKLLMVRIETTTDGQRFVGYLIPNSAVNSVLKRLTRKG